MRAATFEEEKANLYEAWQKNSKRRIQSVGEQEGPDAEGGGGG